MLTIGTQVRDDTGATGRIVGLWESFGSVLATIVEPSGATWTAWLNVLSEDDSEKGT